MQPQKAASSSGARADAEVVGAAFLGSILLGDEGKLELRTVDHELLDVAHAQHERRPTLIVGAAEDGALDHRVDLLVQARRGRTLVETPR